MRTHKTHRNTNGAGEMVQQLGSLAALTEAQVQFPTLTWWLTTACDSSPMTLNALSDPCGHQASMWYTYIHVSKAFIYFKIKYFFKNIHDLYEIYHL